MNLGHMIVKIMDYQGGDADEDELQRRAEQFIQSAGGGCLVTQAKLLFEGIRMQHDVHESSAESAPSSGSGSRSSFVPQNKLDTH